ncbi:PREDICTED: craniofacial development protein 2-like [Vollenhovia emeryi]|uniref:craniofacial development protein 2-like n=1 Tax=Vollenhovia emeryi TaxID=411798 RepID=UPI0005F37B77|nr:PREDICTED: craniofacial development protein 2-like [Vollenhovia emeryi]
MTTPGSRTRTRFVQWNVRTLYQSGKLAQLISECRRLRIDVLGISEMRWNTCGELSNADGDLVLFSGMPNADDPHVNGVGLYLNRRYRKALLSWKAISDRITAARLDSKWRKITIIQCYAPTEESELEAKEQFHSMLDKTLTETNHNDFVILMSDFNARIGNENEGLEHIMGRHGVGQKNENGELLIEICANYGLKIGGSLFIHKEKHKATWMAPNPSWRIQYYQLDHFCVSGKWRRSLLDVRNKRSAEIGSDHYLLLAELRLKIAPRRVSQQPGRIKYLVNKLRDENTRDRYMSTVRAKHAERMDTESLDPINGTWNNIKTSITESAAETLGHGGKRNKDWLSVDFWRLIEDRRAIRDRLLNVLNTRRGSELKNRYADINKRIKKQARKDKRIYFEDMAAEAEEAAKKGDIRTL